MARILLFTNGPEDWQVLLADPTKHWKSGYSARALAHCWEEAAVPEFKVPLPGGARPSQNDIFALARSTAGPVAIMVEGKVNESFGPTLEEWKADASPGKRERLAFLLRTIGLGAAPAGIRYQLLHRAGSAVITAEQYRAVAAVLLIHSFSQERVGWPDYQAFARLFGVEAVIGSVQRLGGSSVVPLFGLWMVGNERFLHC